MMETRKPKKMGKPMMTEKHHRWREFCTYLSGPESIDFRAESADINKCEWNNDGRPLTNPKPSSGNISRKSMSPRPSRISEGKAVIPILRF
jgi:hypothetical protein